MSSTVVHVRAAAVHGGDGPCLAISNPTTLKVQRTGEHERSFNVIHPASVDDSTVASRIAANARDAVGKGKPAGIILFGESSSGKSDLFAQICQEVANAMSVSTPTSVFLVYRNQVLDLLNTSKDGLKVSCDEAKGVAVADGASSKSVGSGSAMAELLATAMTNFEGIAAVKKCTLLHCFRVVIFGTVTIVECPGSERVYKFTMTEDQRSEVAIAMTGTSKIIELLSQVGRGDDRRAVAWNDAKAKVLRFLQGPLGTAMEEANGSFSSIFCVLDDMRSVAETVCTLNVAESAVKAENLKSIAEYKEQIEFYEERLEAVVAERQAAYAVVAKEEAATKQVKSEYEAKITAIADKKEQIKLRVAQAKQKVAAEKEELQKMYAKKSEEVKKRVAEELETLKNLTKNAGATADAEIKKKITAVEAERKEYETKSKAKISSLQEEVKQLKNSVQQKEKDRATRQAALEAGMAGIKEQEAELEHLKHELATAGPSREDGKTEEELNEMRPIWKLRDKVDELEDKVRTMRIECLRYEVAKDKRIGEPQSSESENDSDDDDDDSDDDGDSSGDSDASSDEDTSDDDDDDDSSDEDDSSDDEDAEEKRRKEFEQKQKEQQERIRVARESFDRERRQFLAVSQKEDRLQDLLEQVAQYVEYGTNVRCIEALDGEVMIHNLYMTLEDDRSRLAFYPVDAYGVADRENKVSTFELSNLGSIIMGMGSASFAALCERSPLNGTRVTRSMTPPDNDQFSTENAPLYFYRCLTLTSPPQSNGPEISLVLASPTDFEAWVVTMHRYALKAIDDARPLKDPEWVPPMELTPDMEDIEKLTEDEKGYCRAYHLLPRSYLSHKEKVLMFDRTFITLFDVRSVTELDMFHAQQFFSFLVLMDWLAQVVMHYVAAAPPKRPGAGPPPASVPGSPGSPANKSLMPPGSPIGSPKMIPRAPSAVSGMKGAPGSPVLNPGRPGGVAL
eukprot:PhM_4_TR11673/c0_g1_i1/m.86671